MDEVSGRGVSIVTQSDDQANNKQCAQCAESGSIIIAAGFCRTCNDFLCEACTEQHKNIRGLRSHELLARTDILDQEPASDEEKCHVHSGRVIEAYCSDDDTFGCMLCFRNGHNTCENVALISDLSRGIESSRELMEVQMAADRHKSLEDQCHRAIKKCRFLNAEWHEKALEDFQQFRTDFLSTLDKIGEKKAEEADRLKEENESKLKSLEENIILYSEDVNVSMKEIDEEKRTKQSKRLFLAIKKHGKNVISLLKRMEELHQNMEMKMFDFHTDSNLNDYLSKSIKIATEITQIRNLPCTESVETGIGSNKVHTSSSLTTIYTSASKVNIKSNEDKSDCGVTAILEISATKIILVDKDNSCLKLFDMTRNTIIQRRALSSKPRDMVMLPGPCLAVSIPDSHQIQFFTMDLNPHPRDTVSVTGECLGLQCTGKELIVSYSLPTAQIQILDLTGKVLQSIQHDHLQNILFKNPPFITLNAEFSVIYVSDRDKDTVTCINMEGVVDWIFKNKNLKFPLGVATGDDGYLYICSRNTDTIQIVSPDGIQVAYIPISLSGFKSPFAICYSDLHRAVYVSSASSVPEQRNFIRRMYLR